MVRRRSRSPPSRRTNFPRRAPIAALDRRRRRCAEGEVERRVARCSRPPRCSRSSATASAAAASPSHDAAAAGHARSRSPSSCTRRRRSRSCPRRRYPVHQRRGVRQRDARVPGDLARLHRRPPGASSATRAPPQTIVLFGDSHAQMWLSAVVPAAEALHDRVVLLYLGGCPAATVDRLEPAAARRRPGGVLHRSATASAARRSGRSTTSTRRSCSCPTAPRWSSPASGTYFTDAQWKRGARRRRSRS